MDIKKQVDKLIRDQLDDQQLDNLFIEFLKAPERFKYYLEREAEFIGNQSAKDSQIEIRN